MNWLTFWWLLFLTLGLGLHGMDVLRSTTGVVVMGGAVACMLLAFWQRWRDTR